jgi:hypothetical protein
MKEFEEWNCRPYTDEYESMEIKEIYMNTG